MMSLLLMTAAVLAAQTAPSDAPVPENKRVCRKMPTTGSLIAQKRECRTKGEWDELARAARTNGADMMERNAGGIITN